MPPLEGGILLKVSTSYQNCSERELTCHHRPIPSQPTRDQLALGRFVAQSSKSLTSQLRVQPQMRRSSTPASKRQLERNEHALSVDTPG